jgi:hypothetical protein
MDEDVRLDDVPDGCGCTEIWEYMSERRNGDAETGADGEESADAKA